MPAFAFSLRAALVAALAGAIAVELARTADRPDPLALEPVAAGRPARAERAGPDLARITAYVTTALARPLFRPDRRPPAQAGQTAQAASHGPGLPRLSGIMVSSQGAEAIFEGGSKPVVARVGDHLGAYSVAAIAAECVTLDGPRGTERLVPSFDKTRSVETAQAAPVATEAERLLHPVDVAVPPPPTLNMLRNQRRAAAAQQPPRSE